MRRMINDSPTVWGLVYCYVRLMRLVVCVGLRFCVSHIQNT